MKLKNQKKATTVHLLSAIEDKDGTVGFEYCVNGVTKKVEAKVHPSNGNKAASTFKDVELSKGARLFYYDLSLEKADEIVVRPYRTDADGVTVWGENQTIKLGR